MKLRNISLVIMMLIFAMTTTDIVAKGSSRSSSRSSSKSSTKSGGSSWGSKSTTKSTHAKKAVTPKKTWKDVGVKKQGTQKATTPKKTIVKKQDKKGWNNAGVKTKSPKPTKQQKTIAKNEKKKLPKAIQSKNKNANKKYKGNRKAAAADAKKDLAKKNKYNSPTPPAKRPDNIPAQVTINNVNVNSSYGMMPGGGYGYGYMHPLTGMFMAMEAHHMIVSDRYMMQNGYGTYGAYRSGPTNGYDVIIFFGIIGLIVVVVIGVAIAHKNS